MKRKLWLVLTLALVLLTAVLTLSACGDETQYSVTFIANGEIVDIQYYTEKNPTITEPAVPQKEHYENGAWENYELDGGNKTIHAIYAPIEYKITFLDGDTVVGIRTYTIEDTQIDEPAIPTPAFGYYRHGEAAWKNYTLNGGDKTVNTTNPQKTQAKYTKFPLEDSYYVSGYNKIIDGKIEILPEYGRLPVKSIGFAAFSCCVDDLEYITIPASITAIGDHAFAGCLDLKEVIFDKSSQLISIGRSAFSGCSKLEKINIPAGVTEIGDSAFARCSKLKSIVIPAGVVNIELFTFLSCTSLESVAFANQSRLALVGKEAFSCCSSLKSITIPTGVTHIRSSAFGGCNNLTSVIFENPKGWSSYSPEGTRETEFSESELSDPFAAVKKMRTIPWNYYLARS